MQAGTEMLDVLNRELKYTALKQLLTTALAISMGESLLKYLSLGFNEYQYNFMVTDWEICNIDRTHKTL